MNFTKTILLALSFIIVPNLQAKTSNHDHVFRKSLKDTMRTEFIHNKFFADQCPCGVTISKNQTIIDFIAAAQAPESWKAESITLNENPDKTFRNTLKAAMRADYVVSYIAPHATEAATADEKDAVEQYVKFWTCKYQASLSRAQQAFTEAANAQILVVQKTKNREIEDASKALRKAAKIAARAEYVITAIIPIVEAQLNDHAQEYVQAWYTKFAQEMANAEQVLFARK